MTTYEWLFNQLLSKLTLHCSEGATMNYSGLQSKNADSDAGPSSAGFLFDADEWRRRWDKEMARKRPEPERIIQDLIRLLQHVRWAGRIQDPEKRHGTLEWKQAVANATGGSRTVAARYGVSHQTVCALRKEYRPKDAA